MKKEIQNIVHIESADSRHSGLDPESRSSQTVSIEAAMLNSCDSAIASFLARRSPE